MSDAWRALVEHAIRSGIDILSRPRSSGPEKERNIVAKTLLARTLSNCRAALLLLESRRIVEARILTRCCLENWYWLAALEAQGDKFIQDILNDDDSHRSKRGQNLLASGVPLDDEREPRLRARLREINKRNQKPQQLKPGAVASITDVKRTYPFYEQLSGDACHPETDALSRYIAENEIIAEPPLVDDEVFETFELLSLAVLSVCIGVSQMLGDAMDAPRLNELAKTHVELRNALDSRSRR
jgi:hypothetical protein